MNDRDIVSKLKNRDETGYTALIDRYVSYVAAIVSGIAKGALSVEDIEEVSADVFFSIWQSADRLRDGPLKPYIAQTARNATISRLRKSGCETVPLEDDVLTFTGDPPPDELAALREQQAILSEAVESFGEPDREIFVRFYYFGETLAQIAERLGLGDGATRTRLYRSRQKLRTIFGERGYGIHDE